MQARLETHAQSFFFDLADQQLQVAHGQVQSPRGVGQVLKQFRIAHQAANCAVALGGLLGQGSNFIQRRGEAREGRRHLFKQLMRIAPRRCQSRLCDR